jgi:hypothetical protein
MNIKKRGEILKDLQGKSFSQRIISLELKIHSGNIDQEDLNSLLQLYSQGFDAFTQLDFNKSLYF